MKRSYIYFLLLIIFNSILFYTIVNTYKEKEFQKNQSSEFIVTLNQFSYKLQIIESAQRGYLYTNELVYLEPYFQNLQDINRDLDRIKNSLINQKNMKKSFSQIKIYLKLALNRIQHTIALTKQKEYERVRYIIIHDYGKSYMEKLFKLTQKLIEEEKKILAIKINEYENIVIVIFVLFFLEIAMILFLVVLVFNKKENMELFQNKLESQLDIINSQVPYSKTDLNGVITEVSEAYCNMTLYTKKDLVGRRHSFMKFADNDQSLYMEMWKKISNDEIWHGELKNVKKNGEYLWIFSKIKPDYDAQGKKIGYVSFNYDITSKKDLDEYHANMATSSKMIALGEMIGNIAHQWRQPLSAISIKSTGVLIHKEMGTLSDEMLASSMEIINEQTQYLSKTIDTFRNFIQEQKEIKKLVLQERIDLSLSIVKASLVSSQIHLENKLDYSEPIEMELVEGELPQVIINILNNAKDVLIEKKIKDPLITIGMKVKLKHVRIYIEDNGGGIKKEIINKIFEPYFTTKHESQGTGLGLYMSYKIVHESLKGKLYAKNTKKGARFVIELPRSN